MIIDPEKYAHEYELDAKSMIDCGEESAPVSIVSMRLWLRAAHAVVELTGPSDSDGKTFGSDGSVSLWLHESDLALGNILLDRISSENAALKAIAATLGVGTCRIKPWKMERDTGFYDCMECECGYVSDVSDWAKWNFCPNCGARIEVDG